MDTFLFAATLTSLASFSASGLLLIQNYVNSTKTLKRIKTEVQIIHLILEECRSSLPEIGSLPPSITMSAEACIHRQYDLLKLLYRLSSHKKPKWVSYAVITIRQDELLVLYNSFRDSVLLLRDLSSTLRTEQHFLKLGIAIAQVLYENDEDDTDTTPAGISATKTSPSSRRMTQAAFAVDVQELMTSDFTRSLVVIIQTRNEDGILVPQFVPVRSKYDTGSDENFVSAEILNKNGIDPALITTISEEDRKKRELHMLNNFTFIPKQEVRLSWHKHNDMKQREDVFIIVEDAPFDVLICSKLWKVDSVKTGLLLFGRNKSKAERLDQIKIAEQKERDAQTMIKEQLEESKELLVRGWEFKSQGIQPFSIGFPPTLLNLMS